MNISLENMAKFMLMQKEVIIYYHRNPDGDAIGSAYALAVALQSKGIKANVNYDNGIPSVFQYLTDKFKGDLLNEPVAIAVDSVSNKRLGTYEQMPIMFCIDHHENNTINAEYSYIEEDTSSCSEIILKLIIAMEVKINPYIADLLYTGILTDTSCFRAIHTNSASIITAGKLADYGANVTDIARRNFMSKTPERMQLESILCGSLHYSCDYNIVSGIITFEDYQKTKVDDIELKDIPMILDQIKNIKICIVIRENRLGNCRISLRTSNEFNAAEICRNFGGGGHSTAAGCDIEGNPEVVRKRIEEVCINYYLKSNTLI
ncbi:MAG: bifunctional oligoribonuclease/PAP phosphatase NrnA [Clostridia bacterium]